MRLNTHPENLIERIALRAGVVPTPLGDTIVAMTLARTIMVATKLGIFEVLAKAEYTAQDIATACGLNLHATEVLLFALAGAGYVRSKGKRYALAPVARKWLLIGNALSPSPGATLSSIRSAGSGCTCVKNPRARWNG
jgi:Dimerisation domain